MINREAEVAPGGLLPLMLWVELATVDTIRNFTHAPGAEYSTSHKEVVNVSQKHHSHAEGPTWRSKALVPKPARLEEFRLVTACDRLDCQPAHQASNREMVHDPRRGANTNPSKAEHQGVPRLEFLKREDLYPGSMVNFWRYPPPQVSMDFA